MIRIGLGGWGDHSDLYRRGFSGSKLTVYSEYFSIVEVDSSFYAIQSHRNYEKWVGETPADFSFLVKAYQGMTGHTRGKHPYANTQEMFRLFRESIQPVQESGKLKVVLFQFPPWFGCEKKNVDYLRLVKELMLGIPVALEFRNQTWFEEGMRQKTLDFMESEGWIHSICDEPQAGVGSVPTILYPTDRKLTMVRFHGRNTSGWNVDLQTEQNWREVRYLYHYGQEELAQWKQNLEILQKGTQEICVIFNNNSGGDAASNAKDLAELLGEKVKPFPQDVLAAEQLELF